MVDDNGLRCQFNGVLLLSSVSLNHVRRREGEKRNNDYYSVFFQVPSFFVKQYNVDYVISLKPHPLPTVCIDVD